MDGKDVKNNLKNNVTKGWISNIIGFAIVGAGLVAIFHPEVKMSAGEITAIITVGLGTIGLGKK